MLFLVGSDRRLYVDAVDRTLGRRGEKPNR